MDTRIDVIKAKVPGPEWTRSYGAQASASRVSVLNGFAQKYSAYSATGAFSLKWIPRGSARYCVDRAQHRLAGEKVLLLHAGQPYEIDFLDRSGTESFCLFFSEALLKDALESVEAETEPRPLQFADMVFTPPAELTSALHQLRSVIGDHDVAPERLEEVLLSLLADLVTISRDHQQLVENIPAKRPQTRRLLLGRLQRAREMIDDHQGRPPPLAELARASALSKFHLLRLFKAAFGVSPVQYAEGCRMERGKHLLRQSHMPIASIAETLGYESQSAFTKMFRRHVGVTPHAYRTA
jgi:AraC family transcriptional regulator